MTVDRLPTLAGVLARAFLEDPIVRWPMVDAPDIEERITEFFATIYGKVVQTGVVWEADDGAGLAVWIPPGRVGDALDTDEDQMARLRPLTDDNGAKYEVLWTWVERRVPSDVWYLDAIGVEPRRQGEGIGTALIRVGLDRAEAAGVDAFLETGVERNVGYYEHLGFRVVEQVSPAEGGPHIWFMRRSS